jgi:hypothetical protein
MLLVRSSRNNGPVRDLAGKRFWIPDENAVRDMTIAAHLSPISHQASEICSKRRYASAALLWSASTSCPLAEGLPQRARQFFLLERFAQDVHEGTLALLPGSERLF